MTVRPAQHGNREAGAFRLVKWTGKGSLSLAVHDDNSQLTQTAQAGFEIQEVRVPVAINLYPVAEPGAGRLRVYNFRAGRMTKMALGIEQTGYPYPEDIFADVPFFEIAVEPGDLVLLDGRYLYGGATSGAGAEAPAELLRRLVE